MTPSLSEVPVPIPIPASSSASHSETFSKERDLDISASEPPDPFQGLTDAERSAITSPQLYTSPSLASEESHLPDSSSKDGIVMMTPPLENGETRLHPLLDEHQIESLALKDTSSEAPHAPVDALSQDTSNQYPSPSGGFVPPVTDDDFTLGVIPIAKGGSTSGNADLGEPSTDATREPQGVVTVDEAESSIQPERGSKTVSVQSLSSALMIPRRMSTSSSSSSLGDNHSQAISARSSPSTVAPQRRPSTASQVFGSRLTSVHECQIPLKIRDYAFTELDPRHVGARDVSAPSEKEGHHAEELQEPEAEDEEEGEGSFQEQGLPIGLYTAAYEFVAESVHELSVQVGQKLRLVGHVEGGWAIVIKVKEGEEDIPFDEGNNTESDDKGLVPEAYLEWSGPSTTAVPSS